MQRKLASLRRRPRAASCRLQGQGSMTNPITVGQPVWSVHGWSAAPRKPSSERHQEQPRTEPLGALELARAYLRPIARSPFQAPRSASLPQGSSRAPADRRALPWSLGRLHIPNDDRGVGPEQTLRTAHSPWTGGPERLASSCDRAEPSHRPRRTDSRFLRG